MTNTTMEQIKYLLEFVSKNGIPTGGYVSKEGKLTTNVYEAISFDKQETAQRQLDYFKRKHPDYPDIRIIEHEIHQAP
jgi:hypothetical protein